MRNGTRTLFTLLLTALLLLTGCGGSQFAGPEGLSEALRTAYFRMDYPGGAELARREARFYPDNGRVQAWALYLRAADGERAEMVAEAEEMIEARPEDPMAWMAAALTRGTDSGDVDGALEASRKAYDLAPEDPDVIFTRANALRLGREHEAALDLIERHIGTVPAPADLYVLKGQIHYSLSFDSDHDRSTEMDAAYAALREARRRDPTRIRSHYQEASYLYRDRRADQAVPLIEEALREAPDVLNLHSMYWRTLNGSSELTAEEKKRRILTDLEAFLERRGDDPGVCSSVAYAYGDLGMDAERVAIEDRILADFPHSSEAEWVLVNRYRAFSSEHEGTTNMTPGQLAEYKGMLVGFLDRESFVNESLQGDAWRNLFYLLQEDPTATEAEILAAVEGMVEWENLNPTTTFAKGAIVLAEETDHDDRALEIAQMGIEEGRSKVESQRSLYDTEGDLQNAVNYMEGTMRDAVGWVHFQQGDLEQAEQELLAAYEQYPDNMQNHLHLGRLYEAKGDPDRAETYYMKGMAASTTGENPNEDALKALYAKRNGSMEGWEAYEASLEEVDRERRLKEVLAGRLADPKKAPGFGLKDLEGKTLTLDELAGRVAVINYWGIWCGWCVIEMPEFQQLHERYADDPDVVVLSINNDSNPDDVPPWMTEKGYDFRVLLDDGYVSSVAEVTAFPTSWFLDRQGRIVYEKVGWSEKLLEEFTWRLEDLKGHPPDPDLP